MLVESFEFYLRALQETKAISSDTERLSNVDGNISYVPQMELPSETATPREESETEGCLITFGECCSGHLSSAPRMVEKGACSYATAASTKTPHGSPSSAEKVGPQLGYDNISQQSLLDHNESPGRKVPMPLEPLQTLEFVETPQKQMADHTLASTPGPGLCLQVLDDTVANEKDDDEYAWLREDIPPQESPSPPLNSVSQVDVFSMGSSNQKQNTPLLTDMETPGSLSVVSVPATTFDFKGDVFPIQQRHREMLLKEIAARKNPLEVFVALDVFEMSPCLMQPLDAEQRTSGTYGSTLVHQLMAMDRWYEAAVVVSRFFSVRNATLDLELLLRLLALPDERKDKAVLVHEFVGEHVDACRAVLQEIDQRLSMRLAQWNKHVTEGDHYPKIEFLPGTRSSNELLQTLSTPHACVKLVEIAMSLTMRFQLEESQHQYAGIVFFSRYCTAKSLLEHQSFNLEYRYLQPFSSITTSGTERNKCPTEYALQRPWVLLPVILSTVKGDRMLEMLTIHYCLVERNDPATANFIATKLGHSEYYQHCASKKQSEQPQAVADTIQH
ncbi:hypothetical protein BGZ72_001183, partial [Mortierella alpina]